MPSKRLTLVFVAVQGAALAGAGCSRPLRCGDAPAQLGLHDGAGALLIEARGAAGGRLELCDPTGRRVGLVDRTGGRSDGAVALLDAGGQPRLKLTGNATDAHGDGPGGPRLRLHAEPAETRVLAPDGVPLGSVGRPSGVVTVFDPGSAPFATVEPRDRDQVLRDLDGTVRAFVTPAASPAAAAAFAISGLDRPEQVALYLFWSR